VRPIRNVQGFILLPLVATLIISVVGFWLASPDLVASLRMTRAATTNAALTRGKQALLDYIASKALDSTRDVPGDLPCPDTADPTSPLAGSAALGCSTAAARLGRLPFRTLGLPDLRDESGERLWYVLAQEFAPTNSTTVAIARDFLRQGDIGFEGGGQTYYPGGNEGDYAVALVIAPGGPRLRNGRMQDRRCPGCAVQAQQYLDRFTPDGNATAAIDNAVYTPTPAWPGLSGFRDVPDWRADANDRIIAISRREVIRAIQKRVAAEMAACVAGFRDRNARYPWPAPIDWPAARPNAAESPASCAGVQVGNYTPVNYFPKLYEAAGTTFGRVPKSILSGAASAADARVCPAQASHWWKTWAEFTFYGLADRHRPDAPATVRCKDAGEAAGCLTVVDDSGVRHDNEAVIVVSGPPLPGQAQYPHAQCDLGASTTIQEARRNPANYLEGENALGNPQTFRGTKATATFNDVVVSIR
jgi:hypothetical protein